MNMRFHKCTASDLNLLRHIALSTFEKAFRHLNNPGDFNAYTAQAFSEEQTLNELTNPASHFFLLFDRDRPAGYLKVNDLLAQTDIFDPEALELQRIYVEESYQGKELGKLMLDKALELARESGKKYIWLGVWEKNERAIAFYERAGFIKTGAHDFFMGTDRQTDLIMKKELDILQKAGTACPGNP